MAFLKHFKGYYKYLRKMGRYVASTFIDVLTEVTVLNCYRLYKLSMIKKAGYKPAIQNLHPARF